VVIKLHKSYLPNYLVVRWPLLFSIFVFWLGSIWLKSNYSDEDSIIWIVMTQFVIIIQMAILLFFIFGVLLTFLAWLFFVYKMRNQRLIADIHLGDEAQVEAGFVPIVIVLNGFVFRPFLGRVVAQLVFSDNKVSDKIVFEENVHKRKSWNRIGIKGVGKTLLHDRGRYDVTKIHFQFSDLFNLIGLPYTVKYSKQIYSLPLSQPATHLVIQPNSSEQPSQRINIPKRREGEFIAYKEFESGDNIGRIVWKIYAKTGKLVVRIPEIKNPYASHLNFYASFYEGLNLGMSMFQKELLNQYKDKVRNLWEALERNQFVTQMPSDQEVPKFIGKTNKKNELFQIAVANWQKEKPLKTFINTTNAGFVCVSSLIPAKEIEYLIQKLPSNVPIVVVKLSEAIPAPFSWTVKNLFLKPHPHPTDSLRNSWFISSLRRKLRHNENAIEPVLRGRGNAWLVHTIEIA